MQPDFQEYTLDFSSWCFLLTDKGKHFNYIKNPLFIITQSSSFQICDKVYLATDIRNFFFFIYIYITTFFRGVGIEIQIKIFIFQNNFFSFPCIVENVWNRQNLVNSLHKFLWVFFFSPLKPWYLITTIKYSKCNLTRIMDKINPWMFTF